MQYIIVARNVGLSFSLFESAGSVSFVCDWIRKKKKRKDIEGILKRKNKTDTRLKKWCVECCTFDVRTHTVSRTMRLLDKKCCVVTGGFYCFDFFGEIIFRFFFLVGNLMYWFWVVLLTMNVVFRHVRPNFF